MGPGSPEAGHDPDEIALAPQRETIVSRRAWTLAVIIWSWLWSAAVFAAPDPSPFDPPWPELRLTIEPPIPIRDAPRLPPLDLPLPADPPEASRPIWSALALPIPTRPEPRREPPGLFTCVFTLAPQALVVCGKAHLAQGEWEPALSSFERALSARPEPPVAAEASYWKGEILLRLGRDQEARGAFATSLLAAPRGEVAGFARLALGWLALEARQADEALREFEGLLTLGLDEGLSVYARFGLAAALALAGQVRSAIPEWDALLARQSLPATIRDSALLWQAEGLRETGDLARAVAACERFLSLEPTHPLADGVIVELGRLHLERGAPLDALKSFRWLVAAFPHTSHLPEVHAGMLLATLQLGDRDESRVALRDLIAYSQAPQVLPALLKAGRLALERNEPALAGEIYESIRSQAPSGAVQTFATLMQAESRRRVGDIADARHLFAEARDAGTGADLAALAAYRLAQIAFESKNDAEARREVEGMLSRAGDPPLREAALFLQGEAAYWLRDYAAAISAFRRLLQEFQGGAVSGTSRFLLGWAELRLDRTQEAFGSWQRVVGQSPPDPRRPEALLLLASLWQRRGDPRQAASLLLTLIQEHPEASQVSLALYLRGLALLEANDPASAVEAFRAVVTRDPLFPHIPTLRLALGQGLLRLEKFDEAQSEFRVAASLLSGQPLEAESWLGVGIAALRLGRLADAEAAFRRAGLAPRPLIVQEARYGLALLADRRGDRGAFTQEVVSYAEQFPHLSLTAQLLYLQVGRAVEAGELERAQAAVLRLVSLQPQSEYADDALLRVGRAALARKAYALVRDAFDLLAERYPQSPFLSEARLGAGEAHSALGESAQAQAQYEAFLREADSRETYRSQALLGLARAREATGERIGARRAYEELLRDFSTEPVAIVGALRLGQLLIREQEWDEARAVLRQAIERGAPAQAVEASYWLGELHRAAGHPLEAEDAYLSVVYLYPGEGEWVVKALLSAGDVYRSLQQNREAAIVYRKLLTRSNLPDAVAKSARESLAQLESSQKQ